MAAAACSNPTSSPAEKRRACRPRLRICHAGLPSARASSSCESSPRSMSARADNRSLICLSARACRPKTDSPSPTSRFSSRSAAAQSRLPSAVPSSIHRRAGGGRGDLFDVDELDLDAVADVGDGLADLDGESLQIAADGAHQVLGAFERYPLAGAREHLLDCARELPGLGRLSLDHAAELVDDLVQPRVLRKLLGRPEPGSWSGAGSSA